MTTSNRTQNLAKLMRLPNGRTPAEHFKALCDLSVIDGIAVISEFTPGNDYFIGEHAETLIRWLQSIPELTGVLICGYTGVQRPGILNDDIVAYNWSEQQVIKHLRNVSREEQVHWMFDRLLEIREEWYTKFRAALPKVKIVSSFDSVNLHGTAERMLRVIVQSLRIKIKMQRKELSAAHKALGPAIKMREQELEGSGNRGAVEERKDLELRQEQLRVATEFLDADPENEELKKRVKNLKAQIARLDDKIDLIRKGLKFRLTTREEERRSLEGVEGKNAQREKLDEEIKQLRERITELTLANEQASAEIAGAQNEIDEAQKELSFYRDPETNPNYQVRVETHVRDMLRNLESMCGRHDIEFTYKPGVLHFGSLTVYFENHSGRTWTPLPSKGSKLAKAWLATLEEFRANVKDVLDKMGTNAQELDAIIEGGAHGVFFARWQRDFITPEEAGMHHVNTFYTGGSDGVSHTLFLTVMPWENQHGIAKYTKRGKPARTRLGKTQGTANHPAFQRAQNAAVSGAQILRKHQHRLLSVEPVAYRLFANKDVLRSFLAVATQDDSDNHLNSPEMDPLVTIGTIALGEAMLEQPLRIHGKDIYVGAHHNIGDTAEANSIAWKEAYKYRQNAMVEIRRVIEDTVHVDQLDLPSVMAAAIQHANDMMGGANENMSQTQDVVGWYFWERLKTVLKSPMRLLDAHVSVTGNHYDNANRASGHQEHDKFEYSLRFIRSFAREFPDAVKRLFRLEIVAGGQPRQDPEADENPDLKVHLYGYSTARSGLVESFGMGHDGTLRVHELMRLLIVHEPNNVFSKMVNALAHVGKAGHTHESYLALQKSGHGMWRVFDQKPTTQRVTSTELGYGGIPRTAGIDLTIVSQPGRYWKMTIPNEHMRAIGLAHLMQIAAEEIDAKQSRK